MSFEIKRSGSVPRGCRSPSSSVTEKLSQMAFVCDDELDGGTLSVTTPRGERTIYGPTVLADVVVSSPDSCSMHLGHYTAGVLRSQGVLVPSVDDHGLAPCFGGIQSCTAQIGELVVDRKFAKEALTGSIPGFAYLHAEGLSSMKRYEKGSVLGEDLCGGGYGHLRLFRPGAMRRVARVLGSYPMDSDILAVFRYLGRSSVDGSLVGLSGIVPGATVVRELLNRVRADEFSISSFQEVCEPADGHCYLGAFPGSAKDLVSERLGSDPRWPEVRAVFDESEVKSVLLRGIDISCDPVGRLIAHFLGGQKFVSTTSFLSVMDKFASQLPGLRVGGVDDKSDVVESVGFGARALCSECGFNVVVAGHVDRCKRRDAISDVEKDKRKRSELLGDVLHRMDVALLIVTGDSTQYSKQLERYVSNVAQREYLIRTGVRLESGRSDHSWGSEFERRYSEPEFRRMYLTWLWADYCCDNENVFRAATMADSFCEGGWPMLRLDMFPFEGA